MKTIVLPILLILMPLYQTMRDQSVATRGDHVMGFSHETTAHHFRLYKDGGEIAVSANSIKDSAGVEQIRHHLQHITKMFSDGNFNAPMLIHDSIAPGSTTMAHLKDEICYDYSDTERGARIQIVTPNPQAIDAIHAFLLFQIIDHKTGDAPTIADHQ